jgi:peptidoglycan/xylan/chitin deacetylase (PgdA/CDA1 family)
MYHRVTVHADAHPCSIDVERFRQQLALLRALGYRAVSPVEVAEAIRSGVPLPGRPIAITFDDGYLDTLAVALPLLRRFGFSATCYLVADRVGRTCDWTERAPLMGWAEARAWVEAGMGVGSHSLTHRDLTTLSPAGVRAEIATSRARLEDHLGVPVPSFAYPFNRLGPRELEAVAEAGYRAACAGPELHASVFALPRVSGASPSRSWFALQLLPRYPELRHLYRRVVVRRGRQDGLPALAGGVPGGYPEPPPGESPWT